MIHPIVTHPDPRLREVSQPVQRFDDELARLIADMFETMHDAEGIGLAAIQIGVPLRLAVMQVEENPTRVMANPTYEVLGDSMRLEEGCLSVPGVRDQTKTRADRVHVRALDGNGEPYEFEAEGLEAACVQHEIDHMDGHLYVDRLTTIRRRRVLKRYEQQRETES